MRETTDALIDRLSSQARPVKPLWSPLLRAASLVVPLLGLMSAYAIWQGDTATVIGHLTDPVFAASLVGSLLTGLCALVAAFLLSVPGRSESWVWLPLLPAALWLTAGALQCYQHIQASGIHDFSPLASLNCFIFIMMTGIPIAVVSHFVLRRAVSTNLISVTALAGLGAAMLATGLLNFFHPPGSNPVDFLTHLTAVSAIILYMTTAGRSALASP